MKSSIVVVTVPLQLSVDECHRIQGEMRKQLGPDVNLAVVPGTGLAMDAPYQFEESCGDYCWRAGVQTMKELVEIAGECCGLAQSYAKLCDRGS